jgi:hypothetical protein
MAYALLLFVPLSLALRHLFDAPAGWVFLTTLLHGSTVWQRGVEGIGGRARS